MEQEFGDVDHTVAASDNTGDEDEFGIRQCDDCIHPTRVDVAVTIEFGGV